ncbi:putative glycolipid-binding domain-containing protein [Halodurantibacterium flavum]|uniref:Glycolipid-binding domain-containing protein n=1 Tax=Halodurantibacterium flavum TaxID=1382802 RepID=A0ABW4S1S9_9RHOB
MAITRTIFWRRLDTDGLERLLVTEDDHGIFVKGTILTTENGGCRLDHDWRLDSNWATLRAAVSREGADGQKTLRLDRAGASWTVNGQTRPDLDGASDVDLSLTPFCNTLALRRLMGTGGDRIMLDIAYIDGATLSVARSRQAYDRINNRCFRYRDLGLAMGFEALIDVDDRGFVTRYEGLFERRG